MASTSVELYDLLLSSNDEDSDDDLLWIHHLENQCSKKDRKSWESFTDSEFKLLTRFQKSDLERLRMALRIPDIVRTSSRFVFDGNNALTLTLRRLSYPSRQEELAAQFGLSVSQVSQCTETVIALIYDNWCELLDFSDSRFNEENLRRFADSTAAAGCPLPRCVGFIDGTVRPTCRPIRNQRQVYNGHKRCHAVKFQAVITPDGVISHLSGPFNGNRHDVALLRMSGLMAKLHEHLRDANGQFCLYGDAAYESTAVLVSPYSGASIQPDERNFNTAMNPLWWEVSLQ